VEARWIRAAGGVEWLSVSAVGRIDSDMEAQRIVVAVTQMRGRSEPRRVWNG
jgi:hypothetical protein